MISKVEKRTFGIFVGYEPFEKKFALRSHLICKDKTDHAILVRLGHSVRYLGHKVEVRHNLPRLQRSERSCSQSYI